MTISAPTSLAGLVRKLRLAAALSQEELAGRSGLSAWQINDLERGLRKFPRLDTIRMLAGAIALDVLDRIEKYPAPVPRSGHDLAPSRPYDEGGSGYPIGVRKEDRSWRDAPGSHDES
jgi:transcriptional regulator with XRE-family HTH domain